MTSLFLQSNNCVMEIRRDVFQAIADPTRRAILSLVAIQSMTPGAIAENFNSSRQTISKHIQILSECELLSQTQNGREIYYHLNPLKTVPYKHLTLPTILRVYILLVSHACV